MTDSRESRIAAMRGAEAELVRLISELDTIGGLDVIAARLSHAREDLAAAIDVEAASRSH